jgi:hypothetical protein
MKQKTQFLMLISILLITFNVKAQTWTYSAPYLGTSSPIHVNGKNVVGTLSSGDSVAIGMLNYGTGFIGVTHNTLRHALFGASQTISDILFVNKVNSTYDYYERMRINRFGRVGIGTPTPDTSALLDVSSSNKGLLIPRVALTATNDGTTIPLPATSLLVYNTNGGLAPAGFWYNAGMPGSPNWIQLEDSNAWSRTGNSSTTPSTAAIGTTVNNNFIGTTDAKDWVMATNSLERARITSGGNVGIGTSAPASKLDVRGVTAIGPNGAYNGGYSSDYNMHVGNATNSTNGGIMIVAGGSTGGTGKLSFDRGSNSDGRGRIWYDNSTDKLQFGTTALMRMTIDNVGKVGIGTASPTTILHVSTTSLAIARIDAGLNSQSEIVFANNGSGTGGGGFGVGRDYMGTGAHNFFVYDNVATATRLLIDNTGNVGIGTTTPGSKLDVNGTSNFNGNMTITGTVAITGSGTVTGTWTSSDQMFKTSIDSLSNAVEVINQLKPKSYYYDTANFNGPNKFQFSSAKQYGFIAQEVETVLPELVSNNTRPAVLDSAGNTIVPEYHYKALNYVELIAFLTKGIQEQQNKIDSLKTKTNNQDAVNSALLDRVNQLETRLNGQDATNTTLQNQLNELQSSISSCCSATRSMHIGSTETQSQPLQQMDVKLNDVQSIVLEQNVPNPFAEQTTINYTLPDNTVKAQMLFYNSNGKLIQSTELLQKGKGQLNVFASDLTSGVYTYTLVVDGKVIEAKKMIKQ